MEGRKRRRMGNVAGRLEEYRRGELTDISITKSVFEDDVFIEKKEFE